MNSSNEIATYTTAAFDASGVISNPDHVGTEIGDPPARLQITVDPLAEPGTYPTVTLTVELDLGVLGESIDLVIPARAFADTARLLDALSIHPGDVMIHLDTRERVIVRETAGYAAVTIATRNGTTRVSPARLVRPRSVDTGQVL